MNNGRTGIIPTPNQVSGVLAASIELQQLKKHLGNMLDEWEAQFETGTEYSYESKQQYIEAAKFMSRNYRIIELVEQSLES